jgi:hypothetical protein
LVLALKYLLRGCSSPLHGAESLPVHLWPLPPEKLELELQPLAYESLLVLRSPQLQADR